MEDTNTLNYLFTKEPKLRQLYEKLKRKETALKIKPQQGVYQTITKEKTPYYGNVLADTENLSQTDIDDFMKLYIRDGYYRLRYIFNTYGICELTGTNWAILRAKIHKEGSRRTKINSSKSGIWCHLIPAHSKNSALMFSEYINRNNGLKADDFLAGRYEEG